jgi:enoyl-CoA hydratase
MSTTYESILVETHEQVGLVRINRPKARNALNSTVLHELMGALEAFDADPQIGAMVITGDDIAAGGRH